MNGLSLEALAERLGNVVSRQALHKYEQGAMRPDSKMLVNLSNALNVPSDYFYRETQVGLNNIAFRKLKRLLKSDQNIAVEKTRDFLERYVELENILGSGMPFVNPLEPKEISTPEEAEAQADRMREVFVLGKDPFSNVIELLESKGIRVLEILLHDDFSGMSTWVNDDIPVIVVNKTLDVPEQLHRKRFTVLHELGHLLLNFPEGIEEKQEERLCNIFAGALLLPSDSLREKIGSSRLHLLENELVLIKEEFGISVRAVLIRAKQAGILSDYAYQAHQIELTQRYGKKKEPGMYLGIERANRFYHLLYRAMAEEVISMSKAAALDGLKLAEFRDKLIDQVREGSRN